MVIPFIMQMHDFLLSLVLSKTNPNKIRTFTRDSINTGVMSYETRTLCCCWTTLSLLKVSSRTRSQQHMLSPFCSSGVADGVGGWRDYGVDPSQFSATLMRTCERLVKEGRFTPSNPVGILTSGYYELLQNKVPLLGPYAPQNVHYIHSVYNDTHKPWWSESCFPCEQTYSGEINNIAAGWVR